jgi:hypothetical protein
MAPKESDNPKPDRLFFDGFPEGYFIQFDLSRNDICLFRVVWINSGVLHSSSTMLF